MQNSQLIYFLWEIKSNLLKQINFDLNFAYKLSQMGF